MNIIETYFNNFHFLRPYLLWSLLPVSTLLIFIWGKKKNEERWKKSISQHLQSVVIQEGSSTISKTNIYHILILFLGVFAVSGPTFKKIEKPGANIKTKVVIMMDASRSMNCKDIAPTRLQRAQQKVVDLTQANYGASTALIAYAHTAHTAMPFTQDLHIIEEQAKFIKTNIMPIQGTNVEAAYNLCGEWAKNDSIPVTWVVITDNISHKDRVVTEDFIKRNPNIYIEFLLIGTPEGSPIPISKSRFLKDKSGKTIISHLNSQEILEINRNSNVAVQMVTTSKEDIETVVSHIKQRLNFTKDNKTHPTDWNDVGYYLLPFIAFLLLILFRKGNGTQWVILLLPFLTSCSKLNNTSSNIKENIKSYQWEKLWYTPDQLGIKYYRDGDIEQSLKNFEDPMWRGYILYHQNRFEEAATEYAKIQNAEGFVNFGLCMAELKNYSRAKEAFISALDADPNYIPAQKNLKEIQRLIDQKLKNYHEISNDEDRQNGKSQEDETLKENKGDEEEKEGNGKKASPKDNVNPDNKGDDDYQAIDPNQKLDKEDISNKILSQMNNDPSLFLRRKFQYDLTKMKEEDHKEYKTDMPW
ncbi:VWA domain-containing protein [Halosquirtibacter laminarini]|uniref:VWA domain-containing protein n=1 Tax=Halosquirtibacter laminarini TaxID=3374600 RepID=UPI003747868C